MVTYTVTPTPGASCSLASNIKQIERRHFRATIAVAYDKLQEISADRARRNHEFIFRIRQGKKHTCKQYNKFKRSQRAAWALAEFHAQGASAVAGTAGDSLGADGSG